MTNTRMRDKLVAGETVLNCWLTGTSPSNADAIGRVGYDSVIIDMQHTMANFESVANSIMALAASDITVIVRVAGNDSSMIQRLLDAGADGIMCPLVNNVEEAQAFIDAVRYPPMGKRSVGAYRTSDGLVEYFRRANTDILAIVQIETVEALANAEAIAAVEGLDMIFPGPGDLAVSHGREPIINLGDEEVSGWHKHIADAAHAQGKWAGLLTFSEDDSQRALEWGYDMLCPAMEGGLLVAGAMQTLATTKTLVERRAERGGTEGNE